MLLILFPANVLGKVLDFDPRTWLPANQKGEQDEIPGFWLQRCMALTIQAFGKWPSRSLSLPPFQYIYTYKRSKQTMRGGTCTLFRTEYLGLRCRHREPMSRNVFPTLQGIFCPCMCYPGSHMHLRFSWGRHFKTIKPGLICCGKTQNTLATVLGFWVSLVGSLRFAVLCLNFLSSVLFICSLIC